MEKNENISKPVLLETEYGNFELDRSLSWFSSEDIKIGDYSLMVYLETDEEDGDTADGALQAFMEIAKDFESFDKKNKEGACEFLLDLANDWLADNEDAEVDEITRQMFIESISINEMTVSPEGFVTLYYDDGDMFWGHSIEIDVEADGTVSDADIAG